MSRFLERYHAHLSSSRLDKLHIIELMSVYILGISRPGEDPPFSRPSISRITNVANNSHRQTRSQRQEEGRQVANPDELYEEITENKTSKAKGKGGKKR